MWLGCEVMKRQFSDNGELKTMSGHFCCRWSAGAYLFIRFPTDGGTNVGVASQACVLGRKTAECCGGRFVGIARKVFQYGSYPRSDEACIVFWFNSISDAVNFFCCDPRIKQPDFPSPAGHCEAWAVERYYSPEYELAFNTFMISEVNLTRCTYMEYKNYYATPFANLLCDHEAHPFVCQSDTVYPVRRYYSYPGSIMTIHLFKSPFHLEHVMNDKKYSDLKKLHSDMAYESCTVFTIDPEACP